MRKMDGQDWSACFSDRVTYHSSCKPKPFMETDDCTRPLFLRRTKLQQFPAVAAEIYGTRGAERWQGGD